MNDYADATLYVVDTHALHWYWTAPSRLGGAARAAFSALESGLAIGLVTPIVIAELHFLLGTLGANLSIGQILGECVPVPLTDSDHLVIDPSL